MSSHKLIRRISAVAVVIATTVSAALLSIVSAATFSSANDVPSTLQSGQSANHTLTFTTPSTISEGTSISVIFESAFDTATIVEDDVDVSDDGIDLTTAADCGGTQQVGVVIAADTMTMTICAGDGGQITAGSTVVVEIGTHANASGTGTNQIVNPSSVGTYYVSVATANDSGSIALPIGSDDSVSVSASVASGGGGGGDGGGGGGGGADPAENQADVNPPVISGIVVSQVSETIAVVSWNTDELSTSFVDYGLTSGYEIGISGEAMLVTGHSVTLSGLSAGQTYHFRVRSADLRGNQSTSSDRTFVTLDQTSPVQSEIDVVDITTTSARIVWNTNERAIGAVSFGLTQVYGQSVIEQSPVTSHASILTGLSSGTTYHYQVRSTDSFGNVAISIDKTFITVVDAPPSNVRSVTVVSSDRTNTFRWENPIDADFAGVRILSCTNEHPNNPTDPDCTAVYENTGITFVHSNLQNGTPYYYGLFSFDRAGQFASGALAQGTPRASEEELPAPEAPPVEQPPQQDQVDPQPVQPGGNAPENQPHTGDEADPDEQAPPVPGTQPGGSPSIQEGEVKVGSAVSTLIVSDIQFLVSQTTIELRPDINGVIRLLSSRVLRVALLEKALQKNVSRIVLTIEQESFLLTPNFSTLSRGTLTAAQIGNERAYIADVQIPEQSGRYASAIHIEYTDNTSERIAFTADVVPQGLVFLSKDNESAPVFEARVILYESDTTVWDGSSYGQFNPTLTQVNGTFSWYVPNGPYLVLAEKQGFVSAKTNLLRVTDNIINPILELKMNPEPNVLETAIETLPLPVQAREAAKAIVSTLGTALDNTNEALSVVRDAPGVMEAAEVSVPILAVTAAASGIVLSVAFDFLPFLQYLFTAPILLFWRRKRAGHGVVYNAISKTPIDLAVVRLYRIEDPQSDPEGKRVKLVSSRVTDRAGRYLFLARTGWYRLTATKRGFLFPTEYVADLQIDGKYLDVYHSEPIYVSENNAVISANIPLDPDQAHMAHTPAHIRWVHRLRYVQHSVAFLGVVAAIVFAIIRPTAVSIAMVGVQIGLYALSRRLAKPRRSRSWGIVYDATSGKPLSSVIIRIFEPKYNKLLASHVTGAQGQYSFLLGPNQYYAVYEKGGYTPQEVRPIDLRGNKDAIDFGTDVRLSPNKRTRDDS